MYDRDFMNPQLQVWMPSVLALFAALIVVVITAGLNTRALSAQIDALRNQIEGQMSTLRAEVRGEIVALRAEMKQEMAELRLEIRTQLLDLIHRVERLEEQRGLVRP